MSKANVFFSYSRKDYDLVTPMFHKFLNALKSVTYNKKRYSIEYYWDVLTIPGEKWDDTIKWKMKEADVIVFFVTNNFLDSDYIKTYEIPLALHRQKEYKIHLLPVLVEACDFQESKIGHLQFIANYKGYLTPMLAWRSRKAFLEYFQFALKIAIKNSLAGHPGIFYFDANNLSLADRKKHIRLFAPPEVVKLAKMASRRKKPKPKKPKTLTEKIKKRLGFYGWK